jgi:hypothetical protein
MPADTCLQKRKLIRPVYSVAFCKVSTRERANAEDVWEVGDAALFFEPPFRLLGMEFRRRGRWMDEACMSNQNPGYSLNPDHSGETREKARSVCERLLQSCWPPRRALALSNGPPAHCGERPAQRDGVRARP